MDTETDMREFYKNCSVQELKNRLDEGRYFFEDGSSRPFSVTEIETIQMLIEERTQNCGDI